MDPRISEGARSISVRGLIENDGYFLRPGMTLNISMEILNRDAIMISEKAVFNVGEKHFVFALIENNKVKQMPVEIGQRQRGTVEILSGLAEGDCVVTEGVTKISDGDKVEVR